MSKQQYHKVDIEAGTEPLYPKMQESPEVRWSFIRKVYSILTLQLLLTVAVAAIVVYVQPISQFIVTTGAGTALYSVFNFMSFIMWCLLYGYYQRHPWNMLLLALYTISIAFSLGLTCAFTSGAVILESAILTSVVVVSLTLYTFWAAKKGHDFSFIQPFVCSASLVLLAFILIQIFFPIGKLSIMILGTPILLCGYIIYDTDNLIKRYSYDEYILAAISLYLDVLNLFVSLLSIFSSDPYSNSNSTSTHVNDNA